MGAACRDALTNDCRRQYTKNIGTTRARARVRSHTRPRGIRSIDARGRGDINMSPFMWWRMVATVAYPDDTYAQYRAPARAEADTIKKTF